MITYIKDISCCW